MGEVAHLAGHAVGDLGELVLAGHVGEGVVLDHVVVGLPRDLLGEHVAVVVVGVLVLVGPGGEVVPVGPHGTDQAAPDVVPVVVAMHAVTEATAGVLGSPDVARLVRVVVEGLGEDGFALVILGLQLGESLLEVVLPALHHLVAIELVAGNLAVDVVPIFACVPGAATVGLVANGVQLAQRIQRVVDGGLIGTVEEQRPFSIGAEAGEPGVLVVAGHPFLLRIDQGEPVPQVVVRVGTVADRLVGYFTDANGAPTLVVLVEDVGVPQILAGMAGIGGIVRNEVHGGDQAIEPPG